MSGCALPECFIIPYRCISFVHPASASLLIRMHEKYHRNACTILPEDEHVVVQNMSKAI
jgi:hypothetical protein